MARIIQPAQMARVMAAVLILAGLSAAPTTAGPLDARIVSVGFKYLPADTTIKAGTLLEYTNVDVAPHNLIALRNGGDGKPVFHTDTIGAGTTVPVKGVAKLKPGVYDYTCTLHPEMLGTIFIEAR